MTSPYDDDQDDDGDQDDNEWLDAFLDRFAPGWDAPAMTARHWVTLGIAQFLMSVSVGASALIIPTAPNIATAAAVAISASVHLSHQALIQS